MQIVGHRGCRGLFPENTILGFQKAIELGVDALELDVVVSGDNQVVVSHEPFMSSVTCLKPNKEEITVAEDKQYNLYKMSYAEIQEFDCGLKWHPKFPKQQKQKAYKPLLSEVIEACENFIEQNKLSKIDYIIEIKSNPYWVGVYYPNPKTYVTLLLSVLMQYKFHHRIVLKSFDVAISNEIKLQASHYKQSLLINKDECITNKLKQLTFKPEILGPYFGLLTQNEVKKYQQQGYAIFPWTVNDKKDKEQLKRWGMNGIITDYP